MTMGTSPAPAAAHSATYPTTNHPAERWRRDQRLRWATARTCRAATGSIIAPTISSQWDQRSVHESVCATIGIDIARLIASNATQAAAATAYTHHSGCQAR